MLSVPLVQAFKRNLIFEPYLYTIDNILQKNITYAYTYPLTYKETTYKTRNQCPPTIRRNRSISPPNPSPSEQRECPFCQGQEEMRYISYLNVSIII